MNVNMNSSVKRFDLNQGFGNVTFYQADSDLLYTDPPENANKSLDIKL